MDSGLPTLDHMNGGNFSLHGKTHFTNTSTTPRDNTRVVWLFNCFLFLILFLSCQGGKGGVYVSLRTTLTNILHSPVSLLPSVERLWRNIGRNVFNILRFIFFMHVQTLLRICENESYLIFFVSRNISL